MKRYEIVDIQICSAHPADQVHPEVSGGAKQCRTILTEGPWSRPSRKNTGTWDPLYAMRPSVSGL